MINEKNYKKYVPKNQETFLVHLAWDIVTALGTNINNVRQCVDWYVGNLYGRTSSKTHFARVNLLNELTSTKMTVKVFFKFLLVLKLKRIKLKVTIEDAKGAERSFETDWSLMNFATDKAAQQSLLEDSSEDKGKE